MNRINLLPHLLSSRIAAGEVVERPESVLREFLDNAIDSGGDEIVIEADGGGIDRLTCIDNGCGIGKDDLALIGERHATSKIRVEDDLYNIHTLGFRGEALYSISAVSKLTIKSKAQDDDEAYTLVIDNGKRLPIFKGGPEKGTIITAEGLFQEIPARRAFLKRAQTENLQNRSMIIKKALCYPQISFRYYQDGALKLSYEKAKDLKERVMMLYRPMGIPDDEVVVLKTHGEEFSITFIGTRQDIHRTDRKEIRIYVNGRAVEDFSLQQAVSYGYGELLPGGSYPYSVLFIENDAALTDFNIHPTKKEVKLRNSKEIHHAIVLLIQNGLERKIPEIKREENTSSLFTENEIRANAKKTTESNFLLEKIYTYRESEKPKNSTWLEKAKELKKLREGRREKEEEKEEKQEEISFTYIGQCFSLFLLAEMDDTLYLVDQHAAHERILYDELLSQVSVQKLLTPISLNVESDVDSFLKEHSEIYTKLGIMLTDAGNGKWEIIALPAIAKDIESQIVSFIENSVGSTSELESEIFAIMACKKAIKRGDRIDSYSAIEILKKVFSMDEPVCPHGRTFLVKITEKELMKMVGRTL